MGCPIFFLLQQSPISSLASVTLKFFRHNHLDRSPGRSPGLVSWILLKSYHCRSADSPEGVTTGGRSVGVIVNTPTDFNSSLYYNIRYS